MRAQRNQRSERRSRPRSIDVESRDRPTVAPNQLEFQRFGGNQAVTTLLGRSSLSVQRCGDVPAERCSCHGGTDQMGPATLRAIQRTAGNRAAANLLAEVDGEGQPTPTDR